MFKDFFISYNSADRQWAEWIAYVLEEHGYSVIIQAWDFRPGGNFILDMQKATADAKRTVMVLSDAYLQALYTQPEWAAAFQQDPMGSDRKLLPIRVAPCQPQGMLAAVVYIDFVGKTAEEAEQLLLAALEERAKPTKRPDFPDSTAIPNQPKDTSIPFPGNDYRRILELAAKGSLQEEIDNGTSVSMDIVQELIDAGYLKANIFSSYDHKDSPSYQDTKITLSGREYLRKLQSEETPESTSTKAPQKLSSSERLNLIQTLNALPGPQFDELLFALNPPSANVPGNAAPQGNRSAALLEWLESPIGPGLSELKAILESIVSTQPEAAAQATTPSQTIETLKDIIKALATNQAPKYDLRGAQFGGGFAETVKGDQSGSH